MKKNRASRLKQLKEKLLQIEVPDYPDTFKTLIEAWISEARPIIRHDWKDSFQDFERIIESPARPRVVKYSGGMFELSQQEHRRQWELDVAEGRELRQNLLGFLAGLLALPPFSPYLPSLFYLVAIVVLVGVIFSAYLVTMDLFTSFVLFFIVAVFFTLLGAFSLRRDDALSEEGFLELVKLVFEGFFRMFKQVN